MPVLYGWDGTQWVAAGGAGGDASTNTTASVDGEGVLFSGTGGKTLKRATGSGLALLTSGVQSTVVAPAGAVVGTTDTQTLTNKTLTSPTITGLAADTTGKAAKADALNSATTVVNVSSATAPTSGQVLTATGGTAATWQTPSAAASPLATADFVEDFFAATVTSLSVGAYPVSLSGGATTTPDAEAGHPGIVRRSTGATSGTTAVTTLGTGLGLFPSDTFTLTWIVRLNTNDTNTTVRVGLAGGPNLQPTSGIYIEKLDADTNWFYVVRAISTQTRVDSGVAVSTGWVKFVPRRVDASTIGFSINGGTEATVTTNIPTLALFPWTNITNSAAAAKTLDHDLMRLTVSGLTR